MTYSLTLKRVFFVAGLALAAIALALPSVMAQDAPDIVPNTITVTGIGEASAAPDMATVSVGVELAGTDIATVYSDVNTTVANIKTALEELGIPASDISTANLSMYVNNVPPMGEGFPGQNETRVGNTLNITVRDLSLIEQVIDTAVGAGANVVYGLSFDISDKSALESEARTAALADAADRAGQLATGISVTLGDVVSVVEYNAGYGGPIPYADQAQGGAGGAVIEPGQFTYSLSVTVTYNFSR